MFHVACERLSKWDITEIRFPLFLLHIIISPSISITNTFGGEPWYSDVVRDRHHGVATVCMHVLDISVAIDILTQSLHVNYI